MLVLAAVLPDFRLQSADGESATRVAIAAALGAGVFGLLGAVVWPMIVRALLLVPAFVLGLLVFFLNGSLLLIALALIPVGSGAAEPETAVVVAAAMSAASSAAGTFLAVRDDAAYGRRLARLADRKRRRRGEHTGRRSAPGTVFLQLDGVGHDVLRDALRERRGAGGRRKGPLMPTLAGWAATSHRLTPWRTDWSSQTGASQLAILHGSNEDVPAFRWYEKETGEVLVSGRPAGAAELQRRAVARTGDRGLLAADGASRGNLFSGGAEQVALVLSVAARRGRHNRSRSGYFAYFSDPANATRTAVSYVAEVLREIVQSVRARIRRESPRLPRGGLYPFVRAFATVVERDVVVAAVLGDILSGRTAVYADLVGYDEVAHHSGPRGRDTHQVLRDLDRAVALIARVTRHAPRPYRIVLLSDHGQSPGETFAGQYGLTLEELVRQGRGAAGPPAAGRPPVVLASGNLGLVSFPDLPGRASREEIDRRHPALLRVLADHPGIGFLLVRSEEHGPVVLGPGGAEHRLETGEGAGESPLRALGPGAAEAVRRAAGFPHTADIMVNSAYDPATGAVHAFEEQIGSHGGLGGEQGRPFLLWPRELSAPVRDGGELVGAERVHRVLRRWLREATEPQIPVDRIPLDGRADESLPVGDMPAPFAVTGPALRDKTE
ncbi:phage holin family protein [Streptomyces sp. HU2014]|uniref:Membrane protein n=2 Tax=Streptomyces albireticuli TaxID=1940 RepID=A0A1Z2KY12_9ACTN|nr:phage holin family protein [Streptomyces albireticuli]ARZ66943.1 membrane protein [Streptomyces albireticuli]UQI49446.1 phage holin family protein [Streptomyces sp. HU2014]